MGTFSSYNTDDSTTGQSPLAANANTIIGPIQTEVASKITGSVFADQVGTAYVEQSFDGGKHWDISQSIAITANTGTVINIDVLAPVIRIRYVNGATNQGHLRIFARVHGNRAG